MNAIAIEAHLHAIDLSVRHCDDQLAEPGRSAQDRKLIEELRSGFEARRTGLVAFLVATATSTAAERVSAPDLLAVKPLSRSSSAALPSSAERT